MPFSIVDMFYKTSGYTSESAFSGSDDYIPLLDVTGSYIPIAELFFEKLSATLVTISGDSSGNILDDKIIAELAALGADFQLQNALIDPETGEPENRHWDIAQLYILQSYGIMLDNGQIVMPGHATVRKGMSDLFRVINTKDSVNIST